MSEFNLQLDYYSVLSLHKALLEAKFNTNPENELISGSPLVAEIYVQVREFLIKSEKGAQWNEWFLLRNRPDYRKRAIMRIKKCRRWDRVTLEEKRKIAADFLAPFLYSETELEEVVTEVDQNV